MASKNRRNKVKFKFTKELSFLILFIVAIIVATIALSIPSKSERLLNEINDAIYAYNSANSTSYSTLGKNNHFVSVDNYNDAKAQMDKPGYTYIYYGTLENSTYLENIFNIYSACETYDVATVYLYYATEVANATTDEKNSTTFKNKIAGYENAINNKVSDTNLHFDFLTYPALLVFKDGVIVANSQDCGEDSQYSWSNYINRAFTIGKTATDITPAN